MLTAVFGCKACASFCLLAARFERLTSLGRACNASAAQYCYGGKISWRIFYSGDSREQNEDAQTVGML